MRKLRSHKTEHQVQTERQTQKLEAGSSMRSASFVVAMILGCHACGGVDTRPPSSGPASTEQVPSVEEYQVQVGAERTDQPLSAEELRRARLRAKLIRTEWHWVRFVEPAVGGIDVPGWGLYALTFEEDGTLRVRAHCNEARGAYLIDGNDLTIRLGEVTHKTCPAGSLSLEFIDNVRAASRFYLEGDRLIVATEDETVLLYFVPPPDT